MQSASLTMEFRNLNVHPMYMKVYWCLAKKEMGTSYDADEAAIFLQQMFEDLAAQMLDTDETTIELSAPGSINIKTTSRSIGPWMCPRLLQQWKIKGGRGGWIQPGQTINIKYSRKKSKYLLHEMFNTDDGKLVIPGLTVIPLFKVHMAMGNDTTTVTQHMNMDGHAWGHYFKRITWKNLFDRPEPMIAMTNTKDITFGAGGEGPTDDEMKVDE